METAEKTEKTTTERNSLCKDCEQMEIVLERFIYPANALVKYWYCKKRKYLIRNEEDLARHCVDYRKKR